VETQERPQACTSNVKNGTAETGASYMGWTLEARDRLFRLAYRLLWNRGDAEDALQDAAIMAHEHAGELRDRKRWWPWMCRIVVRRCHELRRQRSRRLRLFQRAGELRQEVADAASLTGLGVELVEMLDRLPRRQREVLVLRHVQGMGFEELAEVLQIRPETARVHALRGRDALLQELRRRGLDREL